MTLINTVTGRVIGAICPDHGLTVTEILEIIGYIHVIDPHGKRTGWYDPDLVTSSAHGILTTTNGTTRVIVSGKPICRDAADIVII